MYPQDLVGKKVLRTKPINFTYYTDASFIQEPILIIEAGDNHLIYKWVNEEDNREIKLESKWIDNNWIEFKE